ncbi:PhnB protein [Pedobacter cryoconitis]|uniref:VOC family protein n=1 Tax=Pedobacter cryoconitis TaxID=188932 RepID=UPI00160F80D5|nr:VOC family protein [Pedobacter cryoconitis]MBB6270631.1 PhnB protein [Pedobacter cryoconitis]
MATVNPYLNFDGNTEEVFNFYKSVFGGEFDVLARFGEMPEDYQADKSQQDKIMHVSLPIGGGSTLMGSDRPASYGTITKGDGFYISIQADSEEEATRLFNGLSANGKVIMPLEKTFWGAFFGMFNDQFGVQWMINYDYNKK